MNLEKFFALVNYDLNIMSVIPKGMFYELMWSIGTSNYLILMDVINTFYEVAK